MRGHCERNKKALLPRRVKLDAVHAQSLNLLIGTLKENKSVFITVQGLKHQQFLNHTKQFVDYSKYFKSTSDLSINVSTTFLVSASLVSAEHPDRASIRPSNNEPNKSLFLVIFNLTISNAIP